MVRKRYEFGPLMMAAMSGDQTSVARLLESGVDANERDGSGATPLMQAALRGHTDILRMLLKAGADPAAQDHGGWTSLHFAAQDRQLESVQILVEGGAPLEIENEHGNTPLWVAVMNGAGDLRIAEFLLQRGADPDRRNRYGSSPREVGDDAKAAALFAAYPPLAG